MFLYFLKSSAYAEEIPIKKIQLLAGILLKIKRKKTLIKSKEYTQKAKKKYFSNHWGKKGRQRPYIGLVGRNSLRFILFSGKNGKLAKTSEFFS